MTSALNPVIDGPNKLKLGLFCTNTSPALTLVPERYNASWANNLKLAQSADRLGLEAIIPIARWKGLHDDKFEHYTNDVLDVFTTAAAIAQATSYSSVFATAHVPIFHPVLAAKQGATIDHISGGRFVLNIVGGWNRREFDMFGINLLEHAERYRYMGEWLGILQRLWREKREFDIDSKYFNIKAALSRPQPVRDQGIPIMNAGGSEVGNRFAAQHADIGFLALGGTDPEGWKVQASQFRTLAKEFGRDIKIWTNALMTIRDTDDEAHAYVHRFSEEMLDVEAVDSCLATMAQELPMPPGSPRYNLMRRILAVGFGLPITGSPATAAKTLTDISNAGFDGVVLTAVDQLDGVERLGNTVLPLLEKAGVRIPFTGT